MNSVQYNPTSIEIEDDRIGTNRRMGDATLRYYHRAFKSRWSIHWSGLRETKAEYTALKALGLVTAAFTFTDVDGTSHSVLILPGGFKRSLAADRMNQLGIKYYDVDLVLDEV
jgi:hypothetical protein